MKSKILVIGNFGYQSNNLNGQTVRTRTIYETLVRYLPKNKYKCFYIDTSKKSKLFKKIKQIFRVLIKYITSKTIILLPAQRAIKTIVPIMYLSNKLFNKHIHFIAIGGWLEDFLNRNNDYIKFFKSFNNIFVQTKSLKRKLDELGLTNVTYLPNYRIYEKEVNNVNNLESIENIVFFSRVTPTKGIEIAIEAINRIPNVKLYVFGPVDNKYKDKFNKLLEEYPKIIYKGVIEPNKILETLSKFDLLIFPTFYEGEGFPGTILDSMTAGVPIIASNWKYNPEILEEGYTGLLFENRNIDELVNKVEFLKNNIEIVNKMKVNCIKESKKYHVDNISKILLSKID